MKKSLYAVIKIGKNTISSKWYQVKENKAVEVTSKLFNDVMNYNESEEVVTKIPFSYQADTSQGIIKYSFGCGLTHYLQEGNLKQVTDLDVDRIQVITTGDFTMFGFKKSEQDWEKVLNKVLEEKGEY